MKDETPRNEINENLQNLHEKIRILLKSTKKTQRNVEEYHVYG